MTTLQKDMDNVSNEDRLAKEKQIELLAASSLAEQAAFLSDLLFRRKYLKNNIKLASKYWNDLRYKKDFQFYIIKANSMLKLYSFKVLYNVLISKKGQSVWSFNCPWMMPEFEKEKVRLENLILVKEKNSEDKMIVDDSLPVFKQNNKTKNRLNNLD
jgi:hypothetical protein